MNIHDFLDKFSSNNFDKTIPYLGWYWRDFPILKGKIPICYSKGDKYVGITINNKWYYDGRYMHDYEEKEFIDIISNAYKYYNDTLDEEGTYKIINNLIVLFDKIRETMDKEKTYTNFSKDQIEINCLEIKNPLMEEFIHNLEITISDDPNDQIPDDYIF